MMTEYFYVPDRGRELAAYFQLMAPNLFIFAFNSDGVLISYSHTSYIHIEQGKHCAGVIFKAFKSGLSEVEKALL